MEQSVERLAALAFVITGLSHLFAPRAWVRLFAALAAQGEFAGLLNGVLHLPLGLLIAAFHPVWRGPGLFVTLVGWALVAKATAQLCFPPLAQRSLKLAAGDGAEARFRIAGAVSLAIGLAAGWVGLR